MSKDTKRMRRSPAQWLRLIAEQSESGLGQVAFCRTRGLSPSSFFHWKRKLAARPMANDEAVMADFVELTGDAAGSGSWEVEFDLGAGIVLRLRRR